MIHATISQVKNSLSAYLRKVRAGETVLIMDRKTPVASLVPVSGGSDVDPRLDRLVAAGLVERGGRWKVGEADEEHAPTRLAGDVDVVAAVVEERRSGR